MASFWQWMEISKHKVLGSALVIIVRSSINAVCFSPLTAWWHSISIVDGLSTDEIRLPMSTSHWSQQFFVNMLTLDSTISMDELDLACGDDLLLLRTSRTATFTLGSSSSSSSSASLERPPDPHRNESLPDLSVDRHMLDSRSLTHSQSLTIDCQRRRPTIENPYLLAPNLQALNNWMIVSPHDPLLGHIGLRRDDSQLKRPSPPLCRVHSVEDK